MSLLEGVQAGVAAMNINTTEASESLKKIIKNSIGAVVDPTTSKVTKAFLVIMLTLCSPLLLACVIVVALSVLAIILIIFFIIIPVVTLFVYIISFISTIKVNCLP